MSQPNNSLGREARQISLPQIGIEGQEKLNNSVVVVIGMGGIGVLLQVTLQARVLENYSFVILTQ